MADEAMNGNSHQLLSAIWEKVADIDKDVDVLRYGKDSNMSDNSALPFMMGMNANRGYDATAMAYNNPWMYLIMLAMFGGGGWGGFGGWGNRGYGVQNGIDTNMLLNAIQAGSATNQRDFDRMANNFGVTASQLSSGIAAVNTSLQQIAGQLGISMQQVINAIQQGDCNIMQAVQNACCENRLAICQQTNQLQQGQWQLGVTVAQQGDMTRALIRDQSFEAQIRQLTRENEQLRDAAQTAKLENDIANSNTAILTKLAEISTQLQNQITAQGYQIATLQGKTASAAS